MAKVVEIPDVGNVEFPDSMSDADIAKVAKTSHEGAQFDKKARNSGIKPEDTLLPGANKWLQENHPNVYSAIEGLMTAIPRGADQMTRGVFRPGLKAGERVSDVLEGGMTAASPALLAVPGAGARAVLNTAAGIGAGTLARGVADPAAQALGASPETARAIGDVAGLVGGAAVAGSGIPGEIPGALRTGARIATDPAVVRAGVGVLPKGRAMLEALDMIKAAKARTAVRPEFPAQPRPAPVQGPAVRPVEPTPAILTPAEIAALPASEAEAYLAANLARRRAGIAPPTPRPAPAWQGLPDQAPPTAERLTPATQEAQEYLAANLARRRAGTVTPEMAQQAAVPFTPEEQALADHVMAGVEPQPPAAPPVGSDYVMPEPAPPEPAGMPNVGDPRLATPPVLPPPTFPQPEAPPATEQPAVNPGPTVNPPTPASTPAVRPADPSGALGAFGVDEPLVLNRAKVRALAKDNGISEWDQLKMLRDQGIKIQDDPFMTGETQRNRRGKVTSPEPMKPETKPAAGETKPAEAEAPEYFHLTSPENAKSIRTEGFRPSADGELGPGVYLANDASAVTAPRFKGNEAIPVDVPGKILSVPSGANSPLQILRELYGRAKGTEKYEAQKGEWFSDGHPNWEALHAEIKRAGYDGLTMEGSGAEKNTVVFDANKAKAQPAATPSAADLHQQKMTELGNALGLSETPAAKPAKAKLTKAEIDKLPAKQAVEYLKGLKSRK